MANLPGRNGVASSIHDPLPQPAATPLSQSHIQQVVWYFMLPSAAGAAADGFTGGFSTATLPAIPGGSLLELIGLAAEGYRVRGLSTTIVDSFGTSGGLAALLLGDPVLTDRWGRQDDLTEGAITNQLDAHSSSEPIAGPGGYALQIAVEGGLMDLAGRIHVTLFWERLQADMP